MATITIAQDGETLQPKAGMPLKWDQDVNVALMPISDPGNYTMWSVDEGNGITADIYFNGDGTLQKSVVTGAGTGTITVAYSDWGKKVDVQAPPKDQVMEMPNLSNPSIPSLSPQ